MILMTPLYPSLYLTVTGKKGSGRNLEKTHLNQGGDAQRSKIGARTVGAFTRAREAPRARMPFANLNSSLAGQVGVSG